MMEATRTYHHAVKPKGRGCRKYEWTCEDTIPFDELIVSWNASRPIQKGKFIVSIAVKTHAWSAWLPYAVWAHEGQGGCHSKDDSGDVFIDQDIAQLHSGRHAFGFRIAVEACDGADLNEFYALYACVSRPNELQAKSSPPAMPSIELNVPLISQMLLPHQRHRDMCSPTSTTAVMAYLLGHQAFDPVAFALKARDETFDIFGNWPLNVAEASAVLGKEWRCWVQRSAGFDDVYARLSAGIPTVVSVRGPLPGSALPYAQGHLMVVKGYDASSRRVLCMDPAFPRTKVPMLDMPFQIF